MELGWSSKWDDLSIYWGGLEPPAVPSKEDVNIFINFLQKSRNSDGSTIILGSTPSLRLAVSDIDEYKNIYCIDLSEKYYEELTKKIKIPREIFIQANWLDMSRFFEKKEIYNIIGDKAIDNIPKEKWKIFFSECFNILNKDGYLILHVGYPDKEVQLMAAEDIVDLYYRSSSSKALSSLWEDLLSHSAQYNNDYLSLKYYSNLHIEKKFTGKKFEFYSLMLEKHISSWEDRWANFDESFLIKTAEESGFVVKDKAISSDYNKSYNQPIYRFSKIDEKD